MLNGSGSRRHHRDLIRQAQYDKLAREAQAHQNNGKSQLLVRKILTAGIKPVMRQRHVWTGHG